VILDSDLKSIIYGDFAVDAVYSTANIKVIYQDEQAQIDFFNGTVTDGGPVAYCYPADVTGIKRGDTITIAGTVYKVLDVNARYMGPTKITLTKDNL